LKMVLAEDGRPLWSASKVHEGDFDVELPYSNIYMPYYDICLHNP
jgi:uncharacterized protein (DUF2225 family)